MLEILSANHAKMDSNKGRGILFREHPTNGIEWWRIQTMQWEKCHQPYLFSKNFGDAWTTYETTWAEPTKEDL